MSKYRFGKNEKIEKVYFIIFYSEKENAKKLGYMWDSDKKSWYKNLIYTKNLRLHYDVSKYHNEKDIYNKYDELINLYDKEPILVDDKPIENNKLSLNEKKIWPFACDYCKELKLSFEEIQSMKKHYYFNKEGCSDCKKTFSLSKYI